MLEFLSHNWFTVLVLLSFTCFILYHVITKQWSDLRGHAYKWMLAAEKAIASSAEGQAKYDQVFMIVYDLIPAWFRKFCPPNLLKQKLQEWYDKMKDELDDGTINNSQNKDTPG